MRVGLDGSPLSDLLTGIGHYTFELGRALAANYPSDQFQLISPKPFSPQIVEQSKRDRLPNLEFINPKSANVRGRWWSLDLPRYLKRAGLDLFHGTNYELPLWRRRHTVVTVHDLSSLLYPKLHRQPLARRMRLRLPLAVRMARAVITPTEAVRRELCSHMKVKPNKVTAIHEAPRQNFRPMSPDESSGTRTRLGVENDFLLFVGTLEPRKNLLTLLKAFAEVLRDPGFRTQLIVAGGEGWLMEETFAFVRAAGIADRVKLIGYVNDNELRALYSSCRAFIYPSLYEGFGLPPLEAMACGAPVIASRIAALAETIGDTAMLVDRLDVQSLGAAITDVCEDEKLRKKMIAAAPSHAAKFSWEKAARSTYEIYRQVVG
jgi:glycosyltransferase involved in cell wall biosynthesis